MLRLIHEIQNSNKVNEKFVSSKNNSFIDNDIELKKAIYKNNDLLLEIDKLNIEIKNLDYKISLQCKNTSEINE